MKVWAGSSHPSGEGMYQVPPWLCTVCSVLTLLQTPLNAGAALLHW